MGIDVSKPALPEPTSIANPQPPDPGNPVLEAMEKGKNGEENSNKINTDGASKGNLGTSGVGCLIRIYIGHLIAASSHCYGMYMFKCRC